MKENVLRILLIIMVFLSVFLSIYMYFQNRKQVEELRKLSENYVEKSEEKLYDVATSYMDIINYIKDNKSSMVVFGKKGCSYCSNYIAVLEDLVKNDDYKVLYVDISSLDSSEVQKLMKSDITIPGKCSRSGENQTLGEGFNTPLSLIYKNDKIVDCIRGYHDYDETLKTLEKIKD